MAVLYTTHYMEEAERLCDRIAIMDAGRIQAEGTRSELITLTGELDHIRLAGPAGRPRGRSACGPCRRCEQVAGDRRTLRADRARRAATSPHRDTATETGMTLSDVEITRPDLESVFLHLTGKALRD